MEKKEKNPEKQLTQKEVKTSIAEKFSRDDRNHLNEYVKKGSEINEELRKNLSGYGNIVKYIKNSFKLISDLYPGYDYIKVCRASTKPYSSEKSQGFMSTSNKQLPFGGYMSTIFIPKDVMVGVVDISDMVGIDGTFEFILQNNTLLYELEENKYVVSSNFSDNNIELFLNASKKSETCDNFIEIN